MPERKVFIVNKSCHDYTPAEEYGQVTFMSNGNFERFNVTKMFREFQPFLDNSTPEDYLLLTGMAVMNSVACAMFSARHKRLNLLLWKERRKGKGTYMEKVLIF